MKRFTSDDKDSRGGKTKSYDKFTHNNAASIKNSMTKYKCVDCNHTQYSNDSYPICNKCGGDMYIV